MFKSIYTILPMGGPVSDRSPQKGFFQRLHSHTAQQGDPGTLKRIFFFVSLNPYIAWLEQNDRDALSNA